MSDDESRAASGAALTTDVERGVEALTALLGGRVIELHGALADVRCLGCGAIEPRAELQERLALLNPGWEVDAELAPDGDVEWGAVDGFRVADCIACR